MEPAARNQGLDFFEYWETFGFFDAIQNIIPPEFMVLFDIARTMFTNEITSDAYEAIEEISKEEVVLKPDRDESIQINRSEKVSPISDKMEIQNFKKITELKKALPRELATDDNVFDVKLMTKSLLVQKFYESEHDSFKPISTSRDERGRDAQRFEQKFYILMDRSKSMDVKMRSFYAKCIIAEFLRRKMKSKVKLYYRPFDTYPGKLFRVEKVEDIPVLIERILLTTTGGKSTNIQAAINQAISDIKFEKEMLKSEILVITDGISKIDKNKMKIDLGNIKLNVLKIGHELAEPDFFEMQQFMKRENLDFDFTSYNIKDIKNELSDNQKVLKSGGSIAGISLSRQRILRYIYDFSENMFKDLKFVSNLFIEIKDLETGGLYKISDEDLEKIKQWVAKVQTISIDGLELEDRIRLYKQVYFLTQYIQMLIENGNENNSTLNRAMENLTYLKQKLLSNPDLMFVIMQVGELDDDKKLMKLSRKEARKMMKEMKLTEKNLSIKQMKKAKMLFTMDVGEGSMGQFFLLLFIKLAQLIKRVVTAPARLFSRKDEKTDDKKM